MINYSSTAGLIRLASGITSGATSITVDTTVGLPSTPFKLIVDIGTASEEIVYVTVVSGLNLTVTRGYDGTTAVAHAAQAQIRHGITPEDLRLSRQHETATSAHGVLAVAGLTETQVITNKNLTSATNTFPATLATLTGAQTLTGKSIDFGGNTVTGTKAQFNAACTDADFATLTGSETLTGKSIDLGGNTVTGTIAQFNTACTDADFATVATTNAKFTAYEAAWSTYTPTWASSGTQPVLGNGTLTGRYHQIGKSVKGQILLTPGSATTFGTGTYTFSLPVASLSALGVGNAEALQTSVRWWLGRAVLATSTTCNVQWQNNSGVSTWDPTTPWTFASGHPFGIEFQYEAV